MTPAQLRTHLLNEMAWYAAGGGDHAILRLIDDEPHGIYAVTATEHTDHAERAVLIMQARIEDELIIVDVDQVFDKKLYQRLLQAGVPREQIVLVYQGEPLPHPVAPFP